jgi:hypothetical protein
MAGPTFAQIFHDHVLTKTYPARCIRRMNRSLTISPEQEIMPLKLTAGVSKKLGLPNYSSVGATCHVELELDSGLIQADPEAFRTQVREVYVQCAESVDEELARHQAVHGPAGAATRIPAEGFTVANGSAPANGNGHAEGNGHTNGRALSRGNGKVPSRPSARQLEYVQNLASRLGLDAEQIEGLCQRLFEKPLEELSSGEASGLIRALQEMREGWLGPDAIYRPEGE